MAYELWTSYELYEVLSDPRRDGPTTWWRDKYFPGVHISTSEEIIFSELPPAMRRAAPFTLPTEQGKPIYRRQGERLKSFTPAYIKVKDQVRPNEARRASPSEILFEGRQLTLAERFDRRVAEIVGYHDDAIRRQWDLMAARSVQYAKITIRYRRDDEAGEGDPVVNLDFGRDLDHSVVLAPGADWSDPDHDILGDLQSWRDRVARSKRGGNINEVYVGASVAPYIRRNNGLKALLNNQVRGNEAFRMNTTIVNSPTPDNPVTWICDVGEGMSVYTYSDSIDSDDGTEIPLMDPKGVFMSCPNVGGVQCFGAIYDLEADLAATDVFMKMFDQDDPSARFILSQSAPLMIPVHVNRTLQARVIQ